VSGYEIRQGDALEVLRTMPDESVNCVVTSPPYWGLRDYGTAGQLGLESSPWEYLERMTDVFREVRRVLRKDGTCWVNMGDCYATGAGKVGDHPGGGTQGERWKDSNQDPKRSSPRPRGPMTQPNRMPQTGLKPKDLVGMPWRLAFALQDDGWYLRQDIIWHKPSPMPESVRDRCTKAHEYLFLLAKSERYYFDQNAILEPISSVNDLQWAGEGSGLHSGEAHVGSRTKRFRKGPGLPGSFKGSLPGRKGGPGQDRRSGNDRGLGSKLTGANPNETRGARSAAFG
jgi:DNA modification methylase